MNPSYKPPKKTRKISRKGLIKKLDNTCAQIIKIRDEHRCQMCGKYVTGSDAHCSHVLAKSRGYFLRWNLLDMKLLCRRCHFDNWHRNPTIGGVWFRDKFPARMKYLDNLKPNRLDKWNDAKLLGILAELQTKLNELKGEK